MPHSFPLLWRCSSLLLGIAMLGTLHGCAVPIRVDYDSQLGIGRCRSFVWQDSTASPVGAFDNPINLQRLRASVTAQLIARGITPVANSMPADCVVGAAIGVRNTVEDAAAPFAWGAGFGWGGRRGGFGFGAESAYVYREGSISVDLYEANSHAPIWHASAQRDVTQLTGTDAEEKINDAVKALFDRFPVRSS